MPKEKRVLGMRVGGVRLEMVGAESGRRIRRLEKKEQENRFREQGWRNDGWKWLEGGRLEMLGKLDCWKREG